MFDVNKSLEPSDDRLEAKVTRLLIYVVLAEAFTTSKSATLGLRLIYLNAERRWLSDHLGDWVGYAKAEDMRYTISWR